MSFAQLVLVVLVWLGKVLVPSCSHCSLVSGVIDVLRLFDEFCCRPGFVHVFVKPQADPFPVVFVLAESCEAVLLIGKDTSAMFG